MFCGTSSFKVVDLARNGSVTSAKGTALSRNEIDKDQNKWNMYLSKAWQYQLNGKA